MNYKIVVRDALTVNFLSSLKTLREQAGLTQKQLAKNVKIPLSAYGNYECGLKFPSLTRLISLAEYFDYDLSSSMNYKRYYGGLPYVKKINCRLGDKIIFYQT